MVKVANQFLCSECGDTFPKWLGKCPSCHSWNTVKEFRESKIANAKGQKLEKGIDLIQDEQRKPQETKSSQLQRISTHIEEVDRVLGGGFFRGSFVLFGGSPGVGKSTLSLQILLKIIKGGSSAFYFSGEESVNQVQNRANRISEERKEKLENIFSTNSLEDIVETVEKNKPEFVIIDSIQMVGLQSSTFGSISQIKESAEILLKLAKSTQTTIMIIGHVTKNDEIAGPRILEHIVDSVLQLEGEKNSEIRILRSPKNRFGSTLEVGVFEMLSNGLRELKNPSEFFLAERAQDAYGSAITVMREGSRNFLIEIQALTVKTNFGLPRRTSHGIDLSKLHLLLAVISKFTPFQCENFDAYLNVISGLKLKEPAGDLAVIAAILSSRAEKEISANTIILGEVGLSGEIRSVSNIEARLIEAEKLGFLRAIVPKVRNNISKTRFPKLEVIEIKLISELIKEIF